MNLFEEQFDPQVIETYERQVRHMSPILQRSSRKQKRRKTSSSNTVNNMGYLELEDILLFDMDEALDLIIELRNAPTKAKAKKLLKEYEIPKNYATTYNKMIAQKEVMGPRRLRFTQKILKEQDSIGKKTIRLQKTNDPAKRDKLLKEIGKHQVVMENHLNSENYKKVEKGWNELLKMIENQRKHVHSTVLTKVKALKAYIEELYNQISALRGRPVTMDDKPIPEEKDEDYMEEDEEEYAEDDDDIAVDNSHSEIFLKSVSKEDITKDDLVDLMKSRLTKDDLINFFTQYFSTEELGNICEKQLSLY